MNGPMDLARAFDAHVMADPDATALVVGDSRWSRRELDEHSQRAVTTLLECGATPGRAVVCTYDTGFDEVALAIASARLGCVFMPIPKRLGTYEFTYVVDLADPVLVAVADPALLEAMADRPVDARNLADVIAEKPTVVETHEWDNEAPAIVGFTSGSTGRPKGVTHCWSAMAWVLDLLVERNSLMPGEAICVTGAGAGAPGFAFYTYLGLAHGLTIVKSERWDPARVVELMARERCVWSTMVPTMLHMLMDAKRDRPDVDISSMRAISMGGAPMSRQFIEEAREVMGFEPLRVYAMAEVMMHCHMECSDSPENRSYFDGRPGPGADIAVFDSEGNPLPVGEVGEVGLRGPSRMLGYLGDPDSLARISTPDGFLLSGDQGVLDERGYIRIVGRIKDMIIRGGFNIDPSEIEGLIRQHPMVRDAAVVGYPDPTYGERACAFLWMDVPGTSLALPELSRHLLEYGLSKEKFPERVECRDELPQSPDGKFLKGDLRKALADEVQAASA
jgi:acyl-CoA synthetase (AMP-forming)/AMP-acid ligase II